MRKLRRAFVVGAIGIAGGVVILLLVWLGAVRLACSRAGQPEVADFGDTSATIIGDSWAAGTGLDDRAQSFAYLLARAQRWNAVIRAVETTGFTAAGPCGDDRTYITRVDGIPRDTAVVLIEGGLNDVNHPGLVADRAVALIKAVNRQAPSAATTVVGPPLVPGRDERRVRAVDAELRRAAGEAGAEYISTLTWRIETADDVHPTAAGHSLFASRLNQSLGNGDPSVSR